MIHALIWALVAALLTISCGLGVMLWLAAKQRRRMRARLQRTLHRPGDGALRRPGSPGWLAQLSALWPQRPEAAAATERLLRQAGWRRQFDYATFAGLRLLLVPAMMLLLLLLLWVVGGRALELSWILLPTVGALGWLLPLWGLRMRARARQARIRREVPMLAQLLRVLIEAGLGLDQALLTVATDNREIIPACSQELSVVMRQVEQGAERGTTLLAMARTLDVQELQDLCEMLRQVYRYGGNVRDPLREFVALLYDRRRIKLQERVGKLAGSMTIIVIIFFFPALLAVVAGPGFIAIWRMLTGIG
ncbi:type II secretion system F family protein [Desulfurivibrio alkaliphilus]|uniref:Type II secretion system F domain protein n=1 Tax=Desulfurivibrio alkaliphilus (strain DSM 19089 / UNIQEM U267 / AHT2) TaxID=589865 RepID=D6Z1P9_DESAT|nr:type II secretion system F family protein [Desulfurivibrio alkaliphilus]ADH85474.1 Type II secretion system F domain protein [Desulfurivibrio alkaliphilus AHT 2]